MEKLFFDNETYIWIGFLGLKDIKREILSEAYSVIESQKETSKFDGYGYREEWKENLNFLGEIQVENNLDVIHQKGLDICKKIYETEEKKEYNKINTESWVNLVRSKNPIQIQFKHEEIKGIDKYHRHTEINETINRFYPNYTFVYYIQMPDIMENEDGVLYIKGSENKEYHIKPEEDQIIVMPGWTPHAPNAAPKSTVDRLVLAGNVGFEFIKKDKSLI